MDKLRSKKRGFFAISTVLSSSSDKKRNKGNRQENDIDKENKAEFKYFKENQCASINANGDYQDFDGVTDDELEQGDTSDHSSSEVETAVSGSSCDDVHKASRKLQTFAKKSIRRDKKKEKEKQERKEKNKLSMDDFLSKQVEFITWLEEEKHKNPKAMSSPKRKAYFKSFLKLWNKRKLPQKYYRGSAEIQSPCPTHPTRTFSFADDEEEVVSFTRPKPKRLSIEPWGPPDSPFSTFGKTPPKHLLTSNLPLLESFSSVTDSSLIEETHNTSGSHRHDSLPKLGEYQMPKNALPMVESGVSTQSTYDRNVDNNATSLPGTPASSFPDNSPVYAVPWKPKPTPRKKPPVVAETVTSPPPPPVPPKSFLTDIDDDNNVTKQPTHHGQYASEICTLAQEGERGTNYEQRGSNSVDRVSVTESCSSMEVDDCGQEMGEPRNEGWHSPIAGKPFSPPVKIRKISALFYNQKESVHSLCDFRFLTNEIKPNIVELSPSNTLMYQTPMVALDCPSGQRIIKGCPFCVMQLPCLCSVTSGTLFLPPRMGSCNNNSQSVTVLHPVNLALIQEFFDPKSHSTIFGDTTFQQYLDLKVPNFKIFNHLFSHFVAADQKQHLNLKKMAKLAQKDATVFQSLAESMLDGQIDFAVTSFPDTSGTIALIASALVLICMIYCIWSFFKIRKLTTIITLTQLPNSAKALPTPHPDLLSLYSNPSQTDNQVTTLQNVYTSFTSPWPYVTLSVLTTLLICFYMQKLWKKFKRTHKTTLHLEITTGTECMLFPITTLPLCPDNWNITPPQVINNIILQRTYLGWANFTINASDLTIQNKHTNTILNIPNTFRLSPLKALRLRRLLQQPYTAYYLLSHHQYYQLLQ